MVDDEPNMRRILVSNLKRECYEVIEAGSVVQARRALTEDSLDAVITDQKLGDGAELDVLACAHEDDPLWPWCF